MGKGLVNTLKLATVAAGLITGLGGLSAMANDNGGKALTPYMVAGAVVTGLLYAGMKISENEMREDGKK